VDYIKYKYMDFIEMVLNIRSLTLSFHT